MLRTTLPTEELLVRVVKAVDHHLIVQFAPKTEGLFLFLEEDRSKILIITFVHWYCRDAIDLLPRGPLAGPQRVFVMGTVMFQKVAMRADPQDLYHLYHKDPRVHWRKMTQSNADHWKWVLDEAHTTTMTGICS
jgi:hypothetical protein